MASRKLPPHFRKMSVSERQEAFAECFSLSEEQIQLLQNRSDLSELSDALIETAVGSYPIPFGLATGFVIDGEELALPMATEEPSVIAAASHAARIVKSGGGFQTWADDPVMSAQIFLMDTRDDAEQKLREAENELRKAVEDALPNLINRGGGWKGMECQADTETDTLCLTLHLNVCDAMGANLVNTAAEAIRGRVAEIAGGSVLMSIVTNAADKKKAGASFSVPEKLFRKGKFSGEAVCRRIVAATDIADHNPERAVTHNKGVMNGISALALATGNDTRAIEAGAYLYSVREGAMRSLTRYRYENGHLHGSIELPLAFGTAGGSIRIWPASDLSLQLLGHPAAPRLSRIAAALGLAQNLAALFALVTEGIQSGHMEKHAARIAYAAGARGEEVRAFASLLWKENALELSQAKLLLAKWRNGIE